MTPNVSESLRAEQTRQDGETLRRIRLDKLLNKSQAAERIGIDRRYLYALETENRSASEVMIRRIARAYGVDSDEIRKKAAA